MNAKSFISAVAVSLVAMVSCQDNIAPENPVENPKAYTVSLACAGELDVTHVPLTKGSSNDLYGIQVYYAPLENPNYQPYAYGLFDNLSNTHIELLADYKYKFVVDYVVEGKTSIYSSNMSAVEDEVVLGYGSPFRTTHSGYLKSLTAVTNQFVITGDDCLYGIGNSCDTPGVSATYAPTKGVDIYYGGISDYVPTTDGAVLNIFMKHMIFGIKIMADDFLKEGEVSLIIEDESYNFDNIVLTPDSKVYEAIYAYDDRASWYRIEEQNKAESGCYLDEILWKKDENTTLALNRQQIKYIRMKQTVVNVTFYEDEVAGTSSLSVNLEDLEMEDSGLSYTFGDDQEEYVW